MKDNSSGQQASLLIATDFSETSEPAVQAGFATADRMCCVPHLVWVELASPMAEPAPTAAPSSPSGGDDTSPQMHHYAEERLDRYVRNNGPASFQAVVSHTRTGDPAREIAALAGSLESFLIVVGTAGRSGMKRLVLGSVAEKVVRSAGRPVLVIPSEQSVKANQEGDDVPAIEPPCPVCVAERRKTNGAEMWCPQHRGPGVQRHTYHRVPRNVAARENAPLTFPMGQRN